MNTTVAIERLRAICSRSEKCPADVRKKLHDWNISELDSETIIAQLQAEGFIDEQRYAHAFVHDKSELQHWGILKIRQALQLKKIAPAIIAEALQEIDADRSKNELLALLQRKNTTLKAASLAERKAKLLRYAVSKGYEYSMAFDSIGQLNFVEK